MAGRTTLLVAHRRSTLHLADRIVVLDQGRVADEGTHEDLMARSAGYRTLLSGIEEDRAETVGDRIEDLVGRASRTRRRERRRRPGRVEGPVPGHDRA